MIPERAPRPQAQTGSARFFRLPTRGEGGLLATRYARRRRAAFLSYPPPPRHALVQDPPLHPPRRPQGRGDRLPQADDARRPPRQARGRPLLLLAARRPRPAQGRADRPRGDGSRGRVRSPFHRAAAHLALGGVRPRRHHGQEHVPPQGPQREHDGPRPHARGGRHRLPPHARLLLPPAPRHGLPDPDEVPRRDPPALRPHALQGVRHEGRLLLRPRLRRGGRLLPEDVRRVSPDLQALRPRRPSGRGGHRRDRRQPLARVHGPRALGRGRHPALPRVPLRRQPGARRASGPALRLRRALRRAARQGRHARRAYGRRGRRRARHPVRPGREVPRLPRRRQARDGARPRQRRPLRAQAAPPPRLRRTRHGRPRDDREGRRPVRLDRPDRRLDPRLRRQRPPGGARRRTSRPSPPATAARSAANRSRSSAASRSATSSSSASSTRRR